MQRLGNRSSGCDQGTRTQGDFPRPRCDGVLDDPVIESLVIKEGKITVENVSSLSTLSSSSSS
mgnify:CR=1 FL=1